MGPERNGTFSERMGRALSAALLPAYYYPGAPLRAIGGFALLTRSFRMRTVHLRLTRYAVQRDCVRPRTLHRSWVCTHCAAAAS